MDGDSKLPPPPYSPHTMQVADSSYTDPVWPLSSSLFLIFGGADEILLIAQSAPLLAHDHHAQYPPEVIIPKKRRNTCCGLSMGIIFVGLCVCCCCVVAIMAAVCGSWATKCSTVSLFRTLVSPFFSSFSQRGM